MTQSLKEFLELHGLDDSAGVIGKCFTHNNVRVFVSWVSEGEENIIITAKPLIPTDHTIYQFAFPKTTVERVIAKMRSPHYTFTKTEYLINE